MFKKRIAVFFTALCALFLFCACEKVEDMGTLPDISKPYVGEYMLERLMIGDRDMTEHFDEAKLSLTYDGKFKLTYQEVGRVRGRLFRFDGTGRDHLFVQSGIENGVAHLSD